MATPPRISTGLKTLPGIGAISWRTNDTVLANGEVAIRILVDARYVGSNRPVTDENHLARLKTALNAQ